MKMKVFERLLLQNILPAEGDILTLRIVRDLREALSFSEKELEALDITQEPGTTSVKWVAAADVPTEIEVGPVAFGLVRERLVALNNDKKLTVEHVPLYERFVEEAK